MNSISKENGEDSWVNLSSSERRSRLVEQTTALTEEINRRHQHIQCSIIQATPNMDAYGEVLYINERVTDFGFTVEDNFFAPVVHVELADIEFSNMQITLKVHEYFQGGEKKYPTFPISVTQSPQDFLSYLNHILETGITRPEVRDEIE